MGNKHRQGLGIVACLAGLAVVALVAPLPSCGGGGPTAPPPAPATTLAPPPPPPTTTNGSGPTINVSTDKMKGKEPLTVSFDLSRSTGTGLTYWADFEGGGLEQKSGSHFTHSYTTDGVTVRHTRLLVRDAAGAEDDKTVDIKVWVDSSVEVKQNTGCQGTIDATVFLKINGLWARASGEVDKVIFRASTVSGNTPLGSRDGDKVNPKQWKSGVWDVKNNTKVRVIAIVSSNGIESEDTPDDIRPEC